ncbi:unnamed protein product [Tetraodon nigroviridis]|uniref:(spotted green pufferfish) hypothetical protein n=1 Tax=Tetraodon nigroviridis TaxID=99883 RepID=Q4RYC8_TETNG|nr:unnamed protein product [Tetraodon nigroviridis]
MSSPTTRVGSTCWSGASTGAIPTGVVCSHLSDPSTGLQNINN